MKASIISFVSFLVLAGCAGTPRLVSANPSSVVVFHDGDIGGAARMAANQCAQYNKDARLIQTAGFIMSFDCVTRDAPVR